MTKVVEFPKNKIVREALNEESILRAKTRSKVKYADDILNGIVDMIIETLEEQGIDINNKLFMKDFSMTVDTIRASIYRQFDIEHPLHKFIDENVTIIYQSGDQDPRKE